MFSVCYSGLVCCLGALLLFGLALFCYGICCIVGSVGLGYSGLVGGLVCFRFAVCDVIAQRFRCVAV